MRLLLPIGEIIVRPLCKVVDTTFERLNGYSVCLQRIIEIVRNLKPSGRQLKKQEMLTRQDSEKYANLFEEKNWIFFSAVSRGRKKINGWELTVRYVYNRCPRREWDSSEI